MADIKADFSKYRFLVVDDSTQVRRIVCSILKRCNALDIQQCGDGTEAMKVLLTGSGAIDCILCDWNMEPTDGLTLLRAIRAGTAKGVARDTRFIMLTGHGDIQVVKAALSADASGFLVKPVSTEKLIQTIETVMARDMEIKPAAHYEAASNVPLPETDIRSLPRRKE